MRWRMDSVQGSAPKTPARRGSWRKSMPFVGGLIDEVEKIAGGAADGGDAEIFHHHELALGVAAGDGDDGGAQRFRAVVGAQPAGEQAVTVGVLDDVAVVQAARGKAADHDIRPDLHIFLRISHHDGFAGGAAGSVQPDDVPHRAGEQAEGIGVAQVGFYRERQLRDVLEVLDVLRFDPEVVQAGAEKRDVLVGAAHDPLQPFQLQFAQLGGRKKIRRAEGVKWTGLLVGRFAGHSETRVGTLLRKTAQ